jgi:hypothetical protein
VVDAAHVDAAAGGDAVGDGGHLLGFLPCTPRFVLPSSSACLAVAEGAARGFRERKRERRDRGRERKGNQTWYGWAYSLSRVGSGLGFLTSGPRHCDLLHQQMADPCMGVGRPVSAGREERCRIKRR